MRIIRVLFSLCLPVIVVGQFGIMKDGKLDKLQEASVDADGKIDAKYESLARDLQSVAPIAQEDALHIVILIDAAKNDPETVSLVARMRSEEGDALKEMSKRSSTIEIVQGLKSGLEELKAIEILFTNPDRAVIEMEKEGLIDKKRLDFYKKNPEALADDTRKAVYFSFVSIAAAGGYL